MNQDFGSERSPGSEMKDHQAADQGWWDKDVNLNRLDSAAGPWIVAGAEVPSLLVDRTHDAVQA